MTTPTATLPSAATILTPATPLLYQAIIILSSFCIFFVVLCPFFIRHVSAVLVFLRVALFPPAVPFSASDLSASACLPCPASVPFYATLPNPSFTSYVTLTCTVLFLMKPSDVSEFLSCCFLFLSPLCRPQHHHQAGARSGEGGAAAEGDICGLCSLPVQNAAG